MTLPNNILLKGVGLFLGDYSNKKYICRLLSWCSNFYGIEFLCFLCWRYNIIDIPTAFST